ncbi:hypothetical protein, partial [Novacetimonas pomaceti]|uniref:hypothetical protein n=1 Tax=Novacetimonas pomaceti TaxID=2021998 RepID=UPI001C2D720D
HDGGCAVPGQRHGAQKKPVAQTRPLIRWSIQVIRRLAMKMTRNRASIEHILRWSFFRRAHQAAAYLSHIKQKAQL